jgi:aryl-alcohol dehydrogenase-like predicted oxidoreductase
MTALHAQVWGPQDDSDTFACVRRALELGINFFDTAEM